MKTLVLAAAVVILSAFTAPVCLAQQSPVTSGIKTAGTYSLTVTISNVNTRKGKVYVGLANNTETFTGTSYKTSIVDVTPSGELVTMFDGLPAGKYAVRMYQDLNDNKQMDFSGQMPSEPFGLSNVTMLMGPPDFDQSAFELTGNQAVKVSMLEM